LNWCCLPKSCPGLGSVITTTKVSLPLQNRLRNSGVSHIAYRRPLDDIIKQYAKQIMFTFGEKKEIQGRRLSYSSSWCRTYRWRSSSLSPVRDCWTDEHELRPSQTTSATERSKNSHAVVTTISFDFDSPRVRMLIKGH